jgi:hypothetical protein
MRSHVMDDRHLPTEQEKVRVVKIIAWRTCLPAAGLLPLSVFGISRMFPEIGDWVLITAAGVLMAAMLGFLAYVAFCLRCPRCSTWRSVGVPKCASCGLRLEGPKISHRTSMTP